MSGTKENRLLKEYCTIVLFKETFQPQTVASLILLCTHGDSTRVPYGFDKLN